MPLYEYRCNNCGETFEALQRFSDEPLKVHEKCGGGPVIRLLSPPAFQFKGSGWYVTDYGRPGHSGGNGKSAGESKPETPAPHKPAAPETPAASKT